MTKQGQQGNGGKNILNGSSELQSRQRDQLIKLLYWIYTEDIDELEIGEEYKLARNEPVITNSFEEAKKYHGYKIQKEGKRAPLVNIITALCELSAESKHHMLFLFVELSEANEYLNSRQPLPALSRSCSFLQHTLSERMESTNDLDDLIRKGSENGVLSSNEERLAQFIRACRNDVSHNFWLETEWSYIVHNHAALCVITLLNSLLESWYGQQWYVKNRLSAKRCLRVIEEEFLLEWNVSERYWEYDSIDEEYERTHDIV